jgi:nitroreductase
MKSLGITGNGNSQPDALQTLLTRYSLGVKHLTEPGPNLEQLSQMVDAALRAPDHGELVPFRFIVVLGTARAELAKLFASHAMAKGKSPQAIQIEIERAMKAPVTIAVVARIDLGHPQVPSHEQWMCVGGAVANLLNAAHALGFAGKMLSGEKARSPAIAQTFCANGETLVGWIALGTAVRKPQGAQRKDKSAALSQWAGPPCNA